MNLLGIGSRIKSLELGVGVVINLQRDGYQVVFVNHGSKRIPFEEKFDILEYVEPELDLVSMWDVEKTLKNILQSWMGPTEMVALGDRWKGGKLILEPGREGVQSKEVPIENFFHKLILVREKLRVLEQKVNSSALEDEAKVSIQQYISACYGSLTTFNILFKESSQQFKSK